MDLPIALRVIRCLVWDTFRQSLASRSYWLIVLVGGLGIALCCSVRIDGTTAYLPPGEIELRGADRQPFTGLNPGEGYVSVGCGALRIRLFRDGESAVVFLQTLVARWVAGAVGMVLVLLWTVGFLPELLHPDAAAVVLSKPAARWCILAGKYLGVVAFVAAHVVVFIGGTWVALGLRTGYWPAAYLWSIPLLVCEFAFLYALSAWLAVWLRRTVLCSIGLLLLWALCASVNYRHLVGRQGDGGAPSACVLEAAYWVLPKPTDVVLLLGEVLESGRHFQDRAELSQAMRTTRYNPGLSLLTSLLFAAAMVGLAGRRLGRIDY
jgi:hypothetical protein